MNSSGNPGKRTFFYAKESMDPLYYAEKIEAKNFSSRILRHDESWIFSSR
jgi:hypothetical protein